MGNLASRRHLPVVLGLVVLGALLLAACGGGSSSSSSSSSTTAGSSGSSSGGSSSTVSEEGGAGSKGLVPEPPTEPPTEIPIKQPLPKEPPHKKVIWLACGLPACQGDLSAGYKNAAAALGWSFEQINYETLKAAEGVQQALNKNPDYIFITGIPPAAFEAQAKEAIKKGIPIFSGFDTTSPEPKTNGLYTQYANYPGYEVAMQLGSWVINDSEGKGKAAMVQIGEYPILVEQTEEAEKLFGAKCPECSIETIDVTVEDVGEGKVPAKIVAFLQSHPETEYVWFTFGDLATGVYPALQTAGLSGNVKLIGAQANKVINTELSKGNYAAWNTQAQEMGGWLSMDAAARLSENLPLEPYEETGNIPTWIIDSPETANEILELPEGEWPGPEGFQSQFEELWQVK
jgi:ribose transport system substrate-binding protein